MCICFPIDWKVKNIKDFFQSGFFCVRTELKSLLTLDSENLHFCPDIEDYRSSYVQG